MLKKPTNYIDISVPEENPGRSFPTVDSLKSWVGLIPPEERIEAATSVVGSLGSIDDPTEAALLLVRLTMDHPGPMIHIVALAYQSLGRAAVLDCLTRLMGVPGTTWPEFTEEWVHEANLATSVRDLVEHGQLRWRDPDALPLRKAMVERGYGWAYLDAPDVTTEGLFEIWTCSDYQSPRNRPITHHPRATGRFWQMVASSGADHGRIRTVAIGSAEARNIPVIRSILFGGIETAHARFTNLIERAGLEQASAEYMAFVLEGLYRSSLHDTTQNAALERLITWLAKRGRLNPEVLAYLCSSDSSAVRQWAQLTIAPWSEPGPEEVSEDPSPPPEKALKL